jgi:hypothetical protein
MRARAVYLVSLFSLALVAGAAAASPAPVVSLKGGEARWFLPGRLHTGDFVRCVVESGAVQAKEPSPPSAGVSVGTDSWTAAGASIQIDRRSNGATQIGCGNPAALAPRRATLPYVIGQNGVGLVRGQNNLTSLKRLYGRRSTVSWHDAARCRVTWPKVGLQATFDGVHCAGRSPLRSASVTGPSWSSLSGVHVGDPVARMRWQVPGAKLVSSTRTRTVWLLATGRPSHGSQLLAVSAPDGTISRLLCVITE